MEGYKIYFNNKKGTMCTKSISFEIFKCMVVVLLL
jgi:hypothetical protein